MSRPTMRPWSNGGPSQRRSGSALRPGGRLLRVSRTAKTKGAPSRAPFAIPGLTRATLPARPNCANRGFAGTKASVHFAQTGPVLGDRPRAGPVPAHPAPPGPLRDDFAGGRSLRVHFARTGPVDVFSWAGPAPGPLAPPVQEELARVVRARPVPVSLPRPPKPGIA